MSHKALVFLSCGQRNGERELAKDIQKLIEDEFGLACYNADSRQGFDDVMSITEHLSRADYYLFIDFKREIDDRNEIPISVFTHQEFALARAWGITEMLAFKEKDLRSHGILGYVLAHPVEFNRDNLIELVRENITKKGWKANYSRNLVPSELVCTERPVQYSDHHGGNSEKIWRIKIENRRTDRAAINTIAILDHVYDSATRQERRPDTTFLKWSGQAAYQKTIFPNSSAEIDAFALRVNQEGVFLHSDSDVHPRKPIITERGEYSLKYLLYADSFPPVHFTIKVNYQGSLQAKTEFQDSATTANLEN